MSERASVKTQYGKNPSLARKRFRCHLVVPHAGHPGLREGAQGVLTL
jgi:hypothetical protein